MARRPKQEETAQWLRNYLAHGSRSRQEIKDAAYQLGISSRTLDRVKLDLGIESVRRGTDYHWRDPDIFEDRVLSQSLNDTIDRAIDRLADKLAIAIRQLGRQPSPLAQDQKPEDFVTPLSELPEHERFIMGFEEEDYKTAHPETLLRYLAFQEKELAKIEVEPPSENRDYRIKRLKNQITQTTEWYNRKEHSNF
jgi:hypothetical protein